MKNSLVLLAVAVFTGIPCSEGAVLTIENITSEASSVNGVGVPIVDLAGNGLTTGFVALYEFGPGAGTPPGTEGELAMLGTSGQLALTVLNPGNNPGPGAFFSSFAFSNPGLFGNGALVGHELYVVIGDGTTAASSTSFAMLATGLSPTLADSPPPGWSENYLLDPADVVLGSVATHTVDWSFLGVGEITRTSIVLGVPEPTSICLSVLGFLVLTLRRGRICGE